MPAQISMANTGYQRPTPSKMRSNPSHTSVKGTSTHCAHNHARTRHIQTSLIMGCRRAPA